MSPAAVYLATGCAVLGVGLLRFAWRRRNGRWLTIAGWLALASGALAWRAGGSSWGKSIALAAFMPSCCAFVVLAMSGEWRGRCKRMTRKAIASAPSEPSRVPIGRGAARALVAGPVALAAALGLAAATALRAPWADADRLVAAGFLLPLAWAAGAVWALMADSVPRVAAVLLAMAAIGFGGAVL